MPAFVPVLIVAHVALAVSLVAPALLLPFALRSNRATIESEHGFVRALLWVQTRASLVVGVGLALTGAALIVALGSSLLGQPWLLVALAIYAVDLGIAFFIQRPSLRRLVGIRAAADDQTWLDRARRQRYVSYVMAGLVGTIGFLMSSKPVLW